MFVPSQGPKWSEMPEPRRRRDALPSRPDSKMPMHPRRVRGGIKLRRREGEEAASWITQRVNRLIEAAAPGVALREGIEYARLGQTKRMTIEDGVVSATVQGRRTKAYTVTIELERFSHADRERATTAMADQAVYAAKLLAGELPANIEDLFSPLGLRLFPSSPGDFRVSSDAPEYGEESARGEVWSKHIVCVASLLAERLGEDPFLLFSLRGLPGEDLVEHLRQRRGLSGIGPGTSTVYQAHIPGVTDTESAPLESCVSSFWDSGDELRTIELGTAGPAVTFPLLRRLGPSPFTEGRFPMMGLLQTCYQVVSESAVRSSDGVGGEVGGGDGPVGEDETGSVG